MTTIRERFTADHDELEEQLGELESAVEGADFPTIQAVWGRFERFLLGHLEAEEAEALPGFEAADPAAAEVIRADHATIRGWLGELGVSGELHTLRKERTDAFLALLRAHREREETVFYAWVDASTDGLGGRMLDTLRGRRRDEPL